MVSRALCPNLKHLQKLIYMKRLFFYVKTCKEKWRSYFLNPLLSRNSKFGWLYFFILPVKLLTHFWCLSVKQQIRNGQLCWVFKGKHTNTNYVHKPTELWTRLCCKAEEYSLSKMYAHLLLNSGPAFKHVTTLPLNFKAKKMLSAVHVQWIYRTPRSCIVSAFKLPWGMWLCCHVLLDSDMERNGN